MLTRAADDPELDVTIRIALAAGLVSLRRKPEAVALLRARVDGAEHPPAIAARLLGMLGTTSFQAGDVDAAVEWGERAVVLADGVGDVHWSSQVRSVLAWVALGRDGDVERAVALGVRSLESVRDAGNPPAQVWAIVFLAVVLLGADRFDEAGRLLTDGLAEVEASGNDENGPNLLSAQVALLYSQGRLTEAATVGEATLASADEWENRGGVLFTLGLSARVALHRGEADVARALLARAAGEMAETGPGLGVDLVWWAEALLREADGDIAGAHEHLALAWQLHPLPYLVGHRWIAVDLVRLAAAADAAPPADLLASLHDLPAAAVPGFHATALRVEGMQTRRPELLRQAIDLLDAAGRPLESAATVETLATMLPGDRVALLREARERYDGCGASGDASRVDSALRSAGGRRGRRPAARPVCGWDSLTPTESAVAAEVAGGSTNRTIGTALGMSRYTVDTHLKHIFQKLQIHSRVELAAEVVRRARTAEQAPSA